MNTIKKNDKTRCFMNMLISLRQPGNGSQNRVQLSEAEMLKLKSEIGYGF